MQPLEYRTNLAVGETKKGYVDITNPGKSALVVTISVQAFRQVDDTGALEFYDNEAVAAGIIPDFTEFELESAQTIRLYFLIKGSQLPSGDVFGVLFATARDARDESDIRQSVRIGTLLSIENGTPGARQADVVHLNVPFFQTSDTLNGSYVIRNRANKAQATGFYPAVTLSIDPLHVQQSLNSRLVFAGRTRTNDFAVTDARLGFYKVTVSHNESVQSTWVFMATGPWLARLIIGVITILAVLSGVLIWRRRRRHQ